MITQNIQRFVLGEDYPSWFKGLDQSKISYSLNTDGTLQSVSIAQAKGTITASVGDSIGILGDGTIIIIPKDAVNKYMEKGDNQRTNCLKKSGRVQSIILVTYSLWQW